MCVRVLMGFIITNGWIEQLLYTYLQNNKKENAYIYVHMLFYRYVYKMWSFRITYKLFIVWRNDVEWRIKISILIFP